jgi:hypothetical protein
MTFHYWDDFAHHCLSSLTATSFNLVPKVYNPNPDGCMKMHRLIWPPTPPLSMGGRSAFLLDLCVYVSHTDPQSIWPKVLLIWHSRPRLPVWLPRLLPTGLAPDSPLALSLRLLATAEQCSTGPASPAWPLREPSDLSGLDSNGPLGLMWDVPWVPSRNR